MELATGFRDLPECPAQGVEALEVRGGKRTSRETPTPTLTGPRMSLRTAPRQSSSTRIQATLYRAGLRLVLTGALRGSLRRLRPCDRT